MRENSTELCAICLCAITERAITVPCNHYTFDFACLARWLQESSDCPLCKTALTAVQYDFRSPTDFKTFIPKQSKPEEVRQAQNVPARFLARFSGRPSLPSRRRRHHSPPSPDTALQRRRYVYRHKLYSLHVGSNRISSYRNFTPQIVATSPTLQSRARMWIRRELRVFAFLYPDNEDSGSTSTPDEAMPRSRVGARSAQPANNAEFLLSYIISILKTVDIKSSTGHAEDLLSEFLGRENSRLFLHELNAWLRSPYTKLEDWDRHVQYREPLPYRFDEQGRGYGRAPVSTCRSRSLSPGNGRRSLRERCDPVIHAPD